MNMKSSRENIFGSIPGAIMVIMFGFSYIAIVCSGNAALQPHSSFLLAWLQIPNFFITLAAVTSIQGGTKWGIGGANTTSAILLHGILKDVTNLETALIIQGLSTLFVAFYMSIFIRYGGFFSALKEDIKVKKGMCMYTDMIHPSLILALSQATALYMIKYSLELSVGTFEDNWWKEIFSVKAIVIWIPSWILGGLSAYLDVRLKYSLSAMTLLLFLPAVISIVICIAMGGLKNIPSNLYWQIGVETAQDSLRQLDFSRVDTLFMIRRLPFIMFGGFMIFIEALLVYKQYALIPRGKENHGNAMVDGRNCLWASLIIGALGGWFGHQSFVESLTNYRMGYRKSKIGAFFELSLFAVFGVTIFMIDSLPAFSTIMLSSTIFYLAVIFLDVWFIQKFLPVMTVFEWVISSFILIAVFVFGFNTGLIIGIIFTSLLQCSDKVYNGHIVDKIEYDHPSRTMEMVLKGHMCHGSVPTIFQHIVRSLHPKITCTGGANSNDRSYSFLSNEVQEIFIDMTGLDSADASITQFFYSLSLLLHNESSLNTLTIVHQFDEGSMASKQLIEVARQSSSLRESQRAFEPRFIIIDTKDANSNNDTDEINISSIDVQAKSNINDKDHCSSEEELYSGIDVQVGSDINDVDHDSNDEEQLAIELVDTDSTHDGEKQEVMNTTKAHDTTRRRNVKAIFTAKQYVSQYTSRNSLLKS